MEFSTDRGKIEVRNTRRFAFCLRQPETELTKAAP